MGINDVLWFIIFIIVIIFICLLRASGWPSNDLVNFTQPVIKYHVYNTTLDAQFSTRVHSILLSSNWNKYHKFKQTYDENEADILIYLKSDKWLEPYHDEKQFYPNGKQIRWSITTQSRTKRPSVFINAKSWSNGVNESGLSINQYREYVINHEFGHALGYHHQSCKNGNRCPVMYQSTRGCPAGKKCGYAPDDRDLGRRINVAYLRISPLDE
jgi:hypothetical protein